MQEEALPPLVPLRAKRRDGFPGSAPAANIEASVGFRKQDLVCLGAVNESASALKNLPEGLIEECVDPVEITLIEPHGSSGIEQMSPDDRVEDAEFDPGWAGGLFPEWG